MTGSFRQQRFTEGVLGNVAMFCELPPLEIAALARQAWVIDARRGDVLGRRGERLPGVMVLGYGLAKLSLRGSEGGERVLRLVAGGECFGASSTLLGHASHYDALALTDAKLVVVPCAPIYALIDRNPQFGRGVVRVLARKALDLIEEVEAVTLLRGGQRLTSYLGSLAQPAEGNGGWKARLPVSKTLVAARLGMKKETLSRLLHKLAADGLIEVSRRDITIPDRERLAGYWKR